MPLWIQERENHVLFNVYVQPRAAKNEIAGAWGDALKVRLTAPPVEGQANRALIRFLSEALGVAPQNVNILGGGTARLKKVSVAGKTAAWVLERLQVD
ncbi:MAG: DUF167 domain-containing protein [Desulfotomaculales bacterium]